MNFTFQVGTQLWYEIFPEVQLVLLLLQYIYFQSQLEN